ncbi:hypothetical protein [Sphingobium sp. DC-2]|uniref:hypothetical protein n=1 Tax=Sphingobium sp. DC-2 TaxID=1303256 RepID=UPI0004C38E0B|nr:hypothetical protein [Sphingobium sp. DC-2]
MTARAFGTVAERLVANKKPGRRTEQPVRRNSYDVGDRRAQVFRPIGDGTKAGAGRWRNRYMQVAEEYDRQMKKKGERHPIGANALRVLKTLLWLPGLDFKTGRLDPAIATVQELTGFARKTVVDALNRLKEHGFLNWVRRTEKTGSGPGEGPQVKQATNAYFFDLHRLHKRAQMRLRQLLRKCMPEASQPATPNCAEQAAERSCDPKLERLLASMATAFDTSAASSENGRNQGVSE